MWSPTYSLREIADLIERFLDNNPSYLQEWNDFVDTPQKYPEGEAIRVRCDKIDYLVNRPGEPDPVATEELKSIIRSIREKSVT